MDIANCAIQQRSFRFFVLSRLDRFIPPFHFPFPSFTAAYGPVSCFVTYWQQGLYTETVNCEWMKRGFVPLVPELLRFG